MNIKLIVFDFDGVLVNSVRLKNNAFEEIYREEFGELTPQVREFLSVQGGIERAKKFKYFYEVSLGREPTEKELRELSQKLTDKVKQVIVSNSVMEGVVETLKVLKKRKMPMYIASGTPHNELNEICRAIDIDSYFVEIFGSPNSKSYVIEKAAADNGIDVANVLMVGDSMTDWFAASETKCHFFGIESQFTSFPRGTRTGKDLVSMLSGLPNLSST